MRGNVDVDEGIKSNFQGKENRRRDQNDTVEGQHRISQADGKSSLDHDGDDIRSSGGTGGAEDNAVSRAHDDSRQKSAQKRILDGNGHDNPLHSGGKNGGAGDAVKKKSPAYVFPSHCEQGNIEEQIKNAYRQKRDDVVKNQGNAGHAAADESPGDENPVDRDGANTASHNDENEVPENLPHALRRSRPPG